MPQNSEPSLLLQLLLVQENSLDAELSTVIDGVLTIVPRDAVAPHSD